MDSAPQETTAPAERTLQPGVPQQHASGQDDRIDAEIDVALIRMAFARLRLSVIMTLAVIALFVGLLWPHFPEALMWNWLCVLVPVAAARYAMWSAFTRASTESQTHPRWRHLFLIAAALAGASWSYGAVTLMPGPGETEAMLLSLTVIAVTAVSMVTLTAQLPAMYGFQLAALGPTAFALYGTGDEVGLLAALIVLAGTIILMIVGRGTGISTRSLLETKLRLSLAFAETEDARARAEAASEAKSQFLATMSHEIRTPMNGVLGMTELLLSSGLGAQQRQWTEAVYASGQHLLGVINDILDFSKIESGHLELERIDFSVIDVVEDALAMFAQPAERKRLELAAQFIPCDAPLRVQGDPFRLRQVIANLVSNAVKFTASGEVIVRVVQVKNSLDSLHLRITVSDTGIGIPDEALSRIFEHFSQADGSTTREFGGTGLGLAISQRLLALMDGTIQVESSPGRGSTFTIDLHLPVAETEVEVNTDHAVLAGVRTLVVDDNATNREILRHQLGSWGMEVSCVEGGAAALFAMRSAVASGRPFGLAILDLHMPQMDGMALARAIQAETPLASTPLVMLSSTYLLANPEERRQAGIRRYLNKPIRRADLHQALVGVFNNPSPQAPAAALPPRSGEPAATLHGHVLLVEDNEINQALAEAMLKKLGLSWILAINGEEAVAAVRKHRFDVVLMDCQMPVMDGFQATAMIRAMDDAEKCRVPIIALTANAMQGDDRACIDAGMNQFLAKPYTLPQLQETLAVWLPPPSATATASAGSRTLAVDDTVINPKALQTLRDLDDSGSDALLRRIVSSFRSAADSQMAKLEAAIHAGQADAVRQVAHSWKSSAANLGAEMFAATLRELEKRGRQNRLDEARSLLPQAQAHQRQALAALDRLFGSDA